VARRAWLWRILDERRLTADQIALVDAWVKQGMPQGDPAKMPPAPKFADGWHLGKPDLILEMPVNFELPASGPDIYRNFVIPTNLTEDKWVRAVEFRPSAARPYTTSCSLTTEAALPERWTAMTDILASVE